eukprot:scaffold162933_cov38-Prasinocladus_malaysianus.AAC.1
MSDDMQFRTCGSLVGRAFLRIEALEALAVSVPYRTGTLAVLKHSEYTLSYVLCTVIIVLRFANLVDKPLPQGDLPAVESDGELGCSSTRRTTRQSFTGKQRNSHTTPEHQTDPESFMSLTHVAPVTRCFQCSVRERSGV